MPNKLVSWVKTNFKAKEIVYVKTKVIYKIKLANKIKKNLPITTFIPIYNVVIAYPQLYISILNVRLCII